MCQTFYMYFQIYNFQQFCKLVTTYDPYFKDAGKLN